MSIQIKITLPTYNMIHDNYTIIKFQQNPKNHRLKKTKEPQPSIIKKNHYSSSK
jgi:hypothetical protein